MKEGVKGGQWGRFLRKGAISGEKGRDSIFF